MPIRKVNGGYKWGSHGAVFKSRAGAARQAAAAAHANGFAGDAVTKAAGVIFMRPDGHVLFIKRSDTTNHSGEWALPGGHIEPGETAAKAAKREVREEIGNAAPASELREVDNNISGEGVDFTTFLQKVEGSFIVRLNHEHTDWRWANPDMPPQPLHPGVSALLVRLDNKAEDEAEDCDMASDSVALAYDKASVRSVDADGRLHVAKTNISKATVNPYFGREIPGASSLGLEAEKQYALLRDPDELEKAAPTFNNLPLLRQHVPVSAVDYRPEDVIGSTGTDAKFESPYLTNSLVIWAKDYISAVENQSQKELSCSYRYEADMTPGIFEGKKYDGVMRNIVGNHVALVKEGRAGPDVVVGDSKMGIKAQDAEHDPSNGQFTSGGGASKGQSVSKSAHHDTLVSNGYKHTNRWSLGLNNPRPVDEYEHPDRPGEKMEVFHKSGVAYNKDKLKNHKGESVPKGQKVDIWAHRTAASGAGTGVRPLGGVSSVALGKHLKTLHTKGKDSKFAGDSKYMESEMARNNGLKAVAKSIRVAMANDASIEDIYGLLDTLDKDPDPEGGVNDADPMDNMDDINPDGDAPKGMKTEEDVAEDDDCAQLRAFLKGKLSDEDIEKACTMSKGYADTQGVGDADPDGSSEEMEPDVPKSKVVAGDRRKRAKDGYATGLGNKNVVSAKAMDAALATVREQATNDALKRAAEIRTAERIVRPYVGELAMDHSSSVAVYQTALKMLGKNVSGITDEKALRLVLESQPLPGKKGGRSSSEARLASDSAAVKSYADMFPSTKHIRHS